MSRGLNREPIFLDDRDRERFLELLEAAVRRYRVRLHAYVLMDNHFHLLIETPEGNLSACMQWIKQAYSMWHNVRHDRVGPLFQGRYRCVSVEDAGWIYELSLYLHLNPLRLARFKLSKLDRQEEKAGAEKPLSRSEVKRRLRQLRSYRWSSYRAYGGYTRPPEWLTQLALWARAGGREPKKAYRKDVLARLVGEETGGVLESLRDQTAIGTETFKEAVRSLLGTADREITGHRTERVVVPLERVIEAVEAETGETVRKEKWGGLARNLVLKAAWDTGGWTLKELGRQMGGLDYVSVHMAIRRLEAKLHRNSTLKRCLERIHREMKR
jgi:REP element-mobilizing transposase RayT